MCIRDRPYVIGQAIIFLPCGFYLLLLSIFFPRIISAVGDWIIGCLPYIHTRCGLSANLECMSEMCCTRLAENIARKKSPFLHHRTTLSGCIFAAEAYIDNRKKMLNTDNNSTCSHHMVNFSLLTAEICWRVWGTPANFNGFCVLACLLYTSDAADE